MDYTSYKNAFLRIFAIYNMRKLRIMSLWPLPLNTNKNEV